MKPKKRLLPALLLSLFAAAATPSQAQQFDNVVVFGDSLSDAGYYRPFLLAIGLPPSLVGVLGRFTTNPGPVWSEALSRYYGITPAASNAGGSIYAMGGARVTEASSAIPPGFAQRPVSTQINEYLGASGGHADPNGLYTMWIGANDIFQNLEALQAGVITPAQLQTNVLGAATAEIGQIGKLQAAGARYIMVFGLPNIGTTPAFEVNPTISAAVTQLSAGYNTTLFVGLASAGLRVIPVDMFTLSNEIAANPSAYGITNNTGMACGPFPPITTASSISSQFCYPGNLVAPNAASTYAYADSVHPTTAVHQIFAQFAESLLTGPFEYSLLGETPLRTHASQMRTISDGLLATHAQPQGGLNVFVTGDGGSFDVDSGIGNPGLNSSLGTVSVGLAMRASDAVTIGAAYADSHASASFGQNGGGFRTREHAVLLFGSARAGGLYGTLVGAIANVDYGDVRRDIFLGTAVRTATSNPGGSNGSVYATAGYDWTLGHFTLGPTVAFTSQSVTVNAFDESGAGAASLHIAEQNRHSQVWSVGAQASARFGDWTPWLRVTADKEQKNDLRFVTATPLSLATGNSYDIPAYRGDDSFVTTAVGVNGAVGAHIGVSVSYFNVSGRSGIKENGVGGVLSYRF